MYIHMYSMDVLQQGPHMEGTQLSGGVPTNFAKEPGCRRGLTYVGSNT